MYPDPAGRIKQIADFAPPNVEAGVGLALQDQSGGYVFFLAGARHSCPPGQRFYAGIGGHVERGEGWIECAQREAAEEIGTSVEIQPAEITWLVPTGRPIRPVLLADQPRPLALYEMIHPPATPRAGKLYRVVIYQARLTDRPRVIDPDEVLAVIALTPHQVREGLEQRPTLAQLIDGGAVILASVEQIDPQLRLYPLGTAEALARIMTETNKSKLAFQLRPAKTTDFDFLYNLKVACLKEYVTATWGWDEEFQRAHFARHFDLNHNQIITVNNHDVGQLQVEYRPDEVFLAGLYILPGYQRRGLGTAVIRELLREADQRPVQLQVLKVNPARHLYERLGFHVTGETDTHYQMQKD